MIIGIDGGGTKTTGVVVDESGIVLKLATVGPTNPNSANGEAIKLEFENLFSQLDIKQKLTADDIVFAGISGAESGGKKEWFQDLLADLLGHSPSITVDNDAITALYSETKGEPGIVCISGTGSIAYGVNEKQERARVGGWGYLINDGYSGFTLGNKLIEYVFARFDEGVIDCALSLAVLEHFQVKYIPDLVPVVYEQGKTRDRIASAARIVVEESNIGNLVCTFMIEQVAEAMLKDIKLLLNRLLEGSIHSITEFPIVLTGGINQHAHGLLNYLQKKVEQENLPILFKIAVRKPILGTVYAALKQSDLEISASFVEKLEASLLD
ncbi:N-acetylglucosamine kinase [Sutcliffiella rhizosphaerae]|uniref:N-acetylmuramic acid/N-acetylglucosamine kinase n=1 Tax=Sutcliffiella rhizosphaerae TaxID=2880967 RepID=A0ABM8YUG3_9BACI|nr:BadF/BadG/BcrA/BcrD ATPase family protein [Sutcliffiella rhizosphaerae]CAG9623628.1 N-acetylmuramic acid/N-acetylglucosamine kinase [Sutcliffiella rhizosphaerae]